MTYNVFSGTLNPTHLLTCFQWWHSGDITRMQNVSEYMLVLSEYMLVLALCLVFIVLHLFLRY